MYQLQIVLVFEVIGPHDLLLDHREDVVVVQERILKSDEATGSRDPRT